MGKRCWLHYGAGILALSAVDHGPASADEMESAAARSDDADADAIIITARRRNENLQDVPMAVAVFSPAALQQNAVSNGYDLANLVPGLSTQAASGSASQPAFSIRGRGLEYGAAAGSVETYFAEVPLSAHQQMPSLPPQYFDLQSVQVLKGPQGTLFGRSTTGGAVLFVPQAPTDEFEGYARLQLGDYGNVKAEGAINLPLAGDKAVLRVAGYFWDRQGYSKTLGGLTDLYTGKVLPVQSFDNQYVRQARATLRLRPADGFENTTIFTYHTDKNRNSSINTLIRDGNGAIPDPTFVTYGPRRAMNGIDLTKPASKTWLLVNTTTYDLSENLTIKNIFSYLSAEAYTRTPNDSDGSAMPVIDIIRLPGQYPAKSRQIINELQLQGKNGDGKLSWILGGSIDKVHEPDLSWIINVGQFIPGVGLVVDTTITSVDSDAYALFGSGTYEVADGLKLTAGLRSSWYKAKTDFYEQIVPVTGEPIPQTPILSGPFAAIHMTPESSFQGFSGDLGGTYAINSDTMIYGGYRRGWKPGGDNIKSPPGQESFGPEKVDNYSVGLKSTVNFGGMRGRFNIEGYYDIYYGAQRSTLTVIPSLGALATVVYNTERVRYMGIDLDFLLEPSPWLMLSGSYAYADGKNIKWSNTPNFGLPGQTDEDLTVNPMPFLSKHKIAATARLHTDLANGAGELAFGITYTYQTVSYWSADADRLSNSAVAIFGPFCNRCVGGGTIPGYSLVNLRAEWNDVMGSNVSLAANANNLTDKVYNVGGSEVLHASPNPMAFGPPRMFTVEASVKF